MINRIKALQKHIRHYQAQAYWCRHEGNRKYLSGFTGSNGWLLVPDTGKAILITDGRYQEQAGQECNDITIIITTSSMMDALCFILYKKKIEKVMIEDRVVSVAEWKSMKKKIKGIQTLPNHDLVELARQQKDATEISHIKKAITIADKAFQQTLPQIKAGLSELEVVALLEKNMMTFGGEGLAFPTIVASGKNSALPHAKPGKKLLRKGELVVIDFGCTYRGYHSDLTRTIAIAKMSTKQQEYYKIVKKTQLLSQKSLISGNLAADSDKKARDVFKSYNLENYFVHSLGHGLGLEIHEAPRLSVKSNEKLTPGTVVTCEPGLYIPGWGGIRIEDDVLITEEGNKWLSQSPANLQVVG